MNYRQASLSDLGAIASLHAKSWQETYVGILSDSYLTERVYQDRLEVWQNRLQQENQNQQLLLVEDGRVLVGFICLMEQENESAILLDNLHIDSVYKGRGLAKKLIAKSLSNFKNIKGLRLYLEVLAKNSQAIYFYEKLLGERTDKGIWLAPCGNQVEEYIYSWYCANELKKYLDDSK